MSGSLHKDRRVYLALGFAPVWVIQPHVGKNLTLFSWGKSSVRRHLEYPVCLNLASSFLKPSHPARLFFTPFSGVTISYTLPAHYFILVIWSSALSGFRPREGGNSDDRLAGILSGYLQHPLGVPCLAQ